MAKAKKTSEAATNRRGHWQEQLALAGKRYERFQRDGKAVVSRFRLERESNENDALYKDRYNILYSSTETMKPSLYATTPKVQATKRQRDRENPTVTMATLLIENVTQYAMEEIDFDDVMNNVVEDYLLPGLGTAWVRYVPTFRDQIDDNGKPVLDRKGDPAQELSFEGLDVDYVHYTDILYGVGRTWKEVPWAARRTYMNKKKVAARFGEEKALRLSYSHNQGDKDPSNTNTEKAGGTQAIVWEIWNKDDKKVIWYSEDYPDDVLDEQDDPLKLRDFFPTPRPLRAVHNTKTMVPKAFYSQYKAQAEELDTLTHRIRILSEALRVIGVYDGSMDQLQNLLAGTGNKMVKIDNWAQFAGQGGMNGAIQYVPIREVAEVLRNTLEQRDIVKAEIYEITGFSDIVRGVSKASETLGAQKIKADWAGGRLRSMQTEVQRFCRDIIRIMSEIICEQFTDETLAVYAGFEPPEVTPEEQAAAAQYAAVASAPPIPPQPGMEPPAPPQPPPPTMRQQAIDLFKKVVALLREEKRRAAVIGIETDSTIMADESQEREDRMAFLGAIGAFLQQAGPMALQYPDMRGLLGAIMMFTIRTFRQSRSVEKEFEDFQKKLSEQPAMPPPGSEGSTGPDPQIEQAKLAAENAKTQAQQAAEANKVQAAQQKAVQDDATKRYEIDQQAILERERMAMDNANKQREFAIKERELAIKERELGIKAETAAVEKAIAIADQDHQQEQDDDAGRRADAQFEVGQANEGERLKIEKQKAKAPKKAD